MTATDRFLTRIRLESVDLRTLAPGSLLTLVLSDDIVCTFEIVEPSSGALILRSVYRQGPGKRRLTVNPGERAHLPAGTRLIAYRQRTEKHAFDGIVPAVGAKASFLFAEDRTQFYGTATVREIRVREPAPDGTGTLPRP